MRMFVLIVSGLLLADGRLGLGAHIAEGTVTMTAEEEVPAPTGAPANAGGTAELELEDDNTLVYNVTVHDLSGPALAAHIHEGAVGVPGGDHLHLHEDERHDVHRHDRAADGRPGDEAPVGRLLRERPHRREHRRRDPRPDHDGHRREGHVQLPDALEEGLPEVRRRRDQEAHEGREEVGRGEGVSRRP